jgi:uncharacterized protein YbjT (DUF2867 family)
MVRRILVTGATGRIGSQLISRLARHNDLAVRAFVRDTRKTAPLLASGADLALGHFEDPQSLRVAMEGIDTVLLITPASRDARAHASSVLAAAQTSGVRKIVRISVFKAVADGPSAITRLHGRTDIEIQESGLTYTILRPPFFMQNLVFLAADSIKREGRLYFGIGDGRLGMIDLRDIVDCAESCVVSEAYDDRIFTVTGPESIGFTEIAARLSHVLGRPVQYVPVPPEAVERSIRALGMDEWYAQVMRDLCRAYSRNWGDLITDSVAHLTGKAPRSFDEFAREVMVPALVVR